MKVLVECWHSHITAEYYSMSQKSSQVSRIIAIFMNLFARQMNIFVWFAKINLYRKHIFWSSWKSINTNISRIIDIFCRSSFGAWAFRLGLEICDVRRWYTGISQIAIQFFIKWNFSVKPFVYEHIQWLYQFSAPLFQKYV